MEQSMDQTDLSALPAGWHWVGCIFRIFLNTPGISLKLFGVFWIHEY